MLQIVCEQRQNIVACLRSMVCAAAFLAGCPSLRAGSLPSGTRVRHSFTLLRADEPCRVDGKLDEGFWRNAEPLEGFRVDADPRRLPADRTVAHLAFNDRALLVAFVCYEPMMAKLAADVAWQGADAWTGDYCELQVFSRPETPYYSPFMQRLDYMNANRKARTQRGFMVTAANRRSDANIHKVGCHTPYLTDHSWDGEWESGVSRLDDRYVIEMAIPWSPIGGRPPPGHTFKLGFARHRKETKREIARFNWYSGENIRVESFDPASFIQEHPILFAPVKWESGRAVLTRTIETADPWAVRRSETTYREALTARPVPLRAAHFYLGIRGFLLPPKIRKRYDRDSWATEEAHFIEELGRAGANGPFLPGFLHKVGEAGLEDLHKRYRISFSYHGGGVSAEEARKAGATIFRPRLGVASFDPVAADLKARKLGEWLKKHGKKPWLLDVRGPDEPFNQIAALRMPGTLERINRELKEKYGVVMGVSVGVPKTPYEDQPLDASARAVPDHGTSLSRIATFRWMNEQLAEAARCEHEVVRQFAPNKRYQAYNRNAVADMDFLDQSLVYGVTDTFSADPYPSFCSYVYGAARSRYHVGFTSKLVTDLAAGKPTRMIIQGCEMIQRYSTPGNVREWASQAAKAGVTMLEWWGNPRLQDPALYKEMLRLSHLWKNLPALDLPAATEIAVIFSDDSRAAAGDEGLHAHYTLHALLGEELGAWFRFVGENHVRRGLQSLEGVKLIVAPQLAYVSKAFAERLAERVRDGATLVVLDPDAISHDIETGPLEEQRLQLVGMAGCRERSAESLVPTPVGRKRFGLRGPLPVRPMRNVGYTRNARVLAVPKDGRPLFTYPDGTPAAYSRRLGRGEVLVFGAMPFHDGEFAIRPSGWDELLRALIDEMGLRRDLPSWRFMFPATGGEVQTYDLRRN